MWPARLPKRSAIQAASTAPEPPPSTLRMSDDATLYYKDWGAGQPVVFSHGWPLNADAWDEAMAFVASHGYRGVAHDRRGHGRSSQPWGGDTMDQYADDLAEVIEQLGLTNVVLVGHSTGGGEVTRYLGRHGTDRVAKAVLVGAVPPLMLRTPENPGGLPVEVFDAMREGVATDRAGYFRELGESFYGAQRQESSISAGALEALWLMTMSASYASVYACIEAFSATDFTEDLRRIDVPTLIIHGDADEIVPIENSAKRSLELLELGELKVYPGAPHGLMLTHRERFHSDLLEFLSR
jgi:non-heme chloroperoxidase